MKPFAEKFYKSTQWQSCREAYLKSKGYLCERCIAKGIIKPATTVHHKKYLTPVLSFAIIKKQTLNFENLEALCADCHNSEHHAKAKRYKVRADGSVEIAPPF